MQEKWVFTKEKNINYVETDIDERHPNSLICVGKGRITENTPKPYNVMNSTDTFFAKIVEVVAGSETELHQRFAELPIISEWGLRRIFQVIFGYNDRLLDFSVNWDAEPVEIRLYLEQTGLEMIQAHFIDSVRNQANPVESASAALDYMFQEI